MGTNFADLSQRVYGVDMEGIAFISIILFLAGTVAPILMVKRKAEESDAVVVIKTQSEGSEPVAVTAIPHREEAPSLQDFCSANRLSKREAEVLNLFLEGKITKEVAEALFVSESTVKTHIRHIYEKSGVRNKVELLKKIRNP